MNTRSLLQYVVEPEFVRLPQASGRAARLRSICGLVLLLFAQASAAMECTAVESLIEVAAPASQAKPDASSVDGEPAQAAVPAAAEPPKVAASPESIALQAQLKMLVGVRNRLAKAAGTAPALIKCESDAIQAMAHPAGFIVLTDGMLRLIKADEDLAAFVLAHEFGHLLARHALEHAGRAEEAAEAPGELQPNPKAVSAALRQQAAAALAAAYGRRIDAEADLLGYPMLLRAGYDPNGAVSAAKRLLGYAEQASRPKGYFLSHPGWSERIAVLDDAVAEELRRRRLSATARDQGELNERYRVIADELMQARKPKALAVHLAEWLERMPESAIAWHYRGLQLQSSRATRKRALDAFETALSFDPGLEAAWMELCVGLAREGYKAESASCARNLRSVPLMDEYRRRTGPPLAIIGGVNPPASSLYIARDPNGSRIITNDAQILKSRNLPATQMPPAWKRLPN